MSHWIKVSSFVLAMAIGFSAQADNSVSIDDNSEPTWMDEFDPNSPDAEAILDAYDQLYQEETGENPWVNNDFINLLQKTGPSCYRSSCAIWLDVDRATQRADLYINGQLVRGNMPVSTGTKGHGTPAFDKHPDGRIYKRYSSTKFPGGDYAGLGNMPYAVFIRGGFAVHGTPKGNWSKLGRRASHGCIRIHPDNAAYFNQLVRENGIYNTWITVR